VPKVVNRDERRELVVAAAGRVIAREGMAAATVRRIATEAGLSSGVLDHYFQNKDDILLEALRASHTVIRARLTADMSGLRGLAALRLLLRDNLPLDADRADETRLEMQFWAASLADDDLAAVQRAESGELRAAVLRYIGEAQEAGDLRRSVPAADLAERLLAFVDGLSVHVLLGTAPLPARRQLEMLDQLLDDVTG
jgi:AcrR family transcriptional regulator